jgi:homoserine kinase
MQPADGTSQKRGTRLRTAILLPCFNEAATSARLVTDIKSPDDPARFATEAGAIVVAACRQGKGLMVRSMLRDMSECRCLSRRGA